jgi:hypothetical protein
VPKRDLQYLKGFEEVTQKYLDFLKQQASGRDYGNRSNGMKRGFGGLKGDKSLVTDGDKSRVKFSERAPFKDSSREISLDFHDENKTIDQATQRYLETQQNFQDYATIPAVGGPHTDWSRNFKAFAQSITKKQERSPNRSFGGSALEKSNRKASS